MCAKKKKALVVVDLQNDITKNYRDVIDNVNSAVDLAVDNNVHVVYIKQINLSRAVKNFLPDTRGSELVSELKVVSENVFTKHKQSACTSEDFMKFIETNEIDEFYLVGADATACIKSTCYNLVKSNYKVNVVSDCITSYDKTKIDGMLQYYESKGGIVIDLDGLSHTINNES